MDANNNKNNEKKIFKSKEEEKIFIERWYKGIETFQKYQESLEKKKLKKKLEMKKIEELNAQKSGCFPKK